MDKYKQSLTHAFYIAKGQCIPQAADKIMQQSVISKCMKTQKNDAIVQTADNKLFCAWPSWAAAIEGVSGKRG